MRARKQSRPDEGPRLVSIDTAAEFLDYHPATIRRWIAAGRLTGYRVGSKTIRVDLNEILALVKPITTVGNFDEAS